LATRNSKERPETLPLKCTIAGEEVVRDVPTHSAPASFILPFFEPPDICLDKEPAERNIYTTKFIPRFFPPFSTDWLEENKISSLRSYEAPLHGTKFALLIAKIAHSYATAECINDPDFSPLLAGLVRKDAGFFPLPYLVGGDPELLPPTDNLHEIQLLRRKTAKRSLLIVRVRLFAFLGTPTYYAVASARPTP
jgi:hypothetical protein